MVQIHMKQSFVDNFEWCLTHSIDDVTQNIRSIEVVMINEEIITNKNLIIGDTTYNGSPVGNK